MVLNMETVLATSVCLFSIYDTICLQSLLFVCELISKKVNKTFFQKINSIYTLFLYKFTDSLFTYQLKVELSFTIILKRSY